MVRRQLGLGSTKVNIAVIAITLVLAVHECGAQQGVPLSLPAGWSTIINGATSANKEVLTSRSNYVLSLEGDPCAITIRHRFSSPVSHLVWLANFFVGSLYTSTQCNMTLTKDGDLQLWAHFQGTWTMIWNTNTAGKGVTRMSFDASSFDSGDFQLLTAKGKVVYHSFGAKEFAILPTQQFRAGDKLVNANEDFNDTFAQELFSTNDLYELRLVGGDLQLFSSYEAGPYKQYWSLKRTLFKGDLSKVAYAGQTDNGKITHGCGTAIDPKQGGIGLFTEAGKVLWTSGAIPPQITNTHDEYFGLDTYGNLKNWYLVKGQYWGSGFHALATNCDVPNFCGPYGLCNKSGTCSCPSGYVKSAYGQRLGCNAINSVDICKRNSLVALIGYDSVFDAYNPNPLKVSLSECKTQCIKDCSCDGLTYDINTGLCYKTDRVLTLRKVPSTTKLAFVKL